MTSRRITRGLVAAAVAGALALGATTPADAGTPSDVLKNLAAKRKSGPYSSGFLNASMDPGQTKNFYVKVKNIGDETQNPVRLLLGGPPELGWSVKWFRGTTNISSEVLGSGFTFKLRAGKAKLFRLRVKAGDGSECFGIQSRDELDHNNYVTLAINDGCN